MSAENVDDLRPENTDDASAEFTEALELAVREVVADTNTRADNNEEDELAVDRSQWEVLSRLDRDLRSAAANLGPEEARFLVDMYYQMQDVRIRFSHQKRQTEVHSEPNRVITWGLTNIRRVEGDIKRALGSFAEAYSVGRWCMSNFGIGPVISAGLLAHLDIRNTPTVGKWWRFAGMDPSRIWHGKEDAKRMLEQISPGSKLHNFTLAKAQELSALCNVNPVRLQQIWTNGFAKCKKYAALEKYLAARPWNADLKTLCAFKMGECFVKFQNNEACDYGHLFQARKALEVERNMQGAFSDQAAKILSKEKRKDDAYATKWMKGCFTAETMAKVLTLDQSKRLPYLNKKAGKPGSGVVMLSPAHIHARARRYAVKIFMSHLHHVMYVDFNGEDPPKPFIIEHSDGTHTHTIPIPHFPLADDLGGKPLSDLYAPRPAPEVDEDDSEDEASEE
ncbi:hypothetical protein [uncultured Mediterranean phage]|nr:hypothetical protein [uncultured Mediterranean phage]